MEFNAIRKEMKSFTFEVLRTDCDNLFEGVIIKEELDKLNSQLKNLFGEPVFPSKIRLTHKMQETVDGLGGVVPGQTLYYNDSGRESILAMLWPWKDGRRTTVKIVQPEI
jgi:hypothetical protein